MNKLLALILAAVMVFAVSGCGEDKEVIGGADAPVVNTEGEKAPEQPENEKAPVSEEELSPMTEEEKKESEKAIKEAYEDVIEDAVLIKRADFVKKYDDSVLADGLDERNCLSKNPVSEEEVPEAIAATYSEAKKRYRYSMGVAEDGTEFMSLDLVTDKEDNILYFSYQLMGKVWDNDEKVRGLYMAQCGQLFAGFIGEDYESGYDKVVDAYKAAVSGEAQTYSYWNDYRYFMTNTSDGSYVGFVIQAPFVEQAE